MHNVNPDLDYHRLDIYTPSSTPAYIQGVGGVDTNQLVCLSVQMSYEQVFLNK